MEAAYLSSPEEALGLFGVVEQEGLSDVQVQKATDKYGRNGTVHERGSSAKEQH